MHVQNRVGLTQAQLARKMGGTQLVVARLESGRTRPSMRTLERLAAAPGHGCSSVLSHATQSNARLPQPAEQAAALFAVLNSACPSHGIESQVRGPSCKIHPLDPRYHEICFMPALSTELTKAEQISIYLRFSRAEWAALRAATPLPLTETELSALRGINEELSLEEVANIYLPLSRLLNLYVSAIQSLHKATDTFLGSLPAKVPFVIGIAGSVAVGKSTMARVLQTLLSRWPNHPSVDLITTDGFLYPTAVLEKRGLMNRKGFPESYDQRRLVRFLTEIKSGKAGVSAPVYSHLIYDIVPGAAQTICQPDVLIVEGLNVLQSSRGSRTFVSDFFDFSIYIDAKEETIENWYVARFLKLRETVFRNPESYFNRYSKLTQEEATDKAHSIWRQINGPNLRDNIQPTRERAQLILRKGTGHSIEEVRLRKL